VPDDVPLETGLNFVAWAGTPDLDAAQAVASIAAQVEVVWQYDGAEFQSYIPGVSKGAFSLGRGNAIWLRAAEPTRWSQPGVAVARAVEYRLADATIQQFQFPEGSRFRDMLVRIEGLIAVPDTGRPAPVAVILHGRHAICRAVGDPEIGPPWPCPDADTIRNYQGFGTLVEALARAGYVAIAPNINAQFTFSFAEARGLDRLRQVVDRHLASLQNDAAAFPAPLPPVDLERIVLIGHSQGGNFAAQLARDASELGTLPAPPDIAALVLVAPILTSDPSLPDVPLAVLLPACDGDVATLEGQGYLERARAQPRAHETLTVYLEGANHNGFNATLTPDRIPPGRPDCEPLLHGSAQRAFLGAFATTFADAVFAGTAAEAARATLGLRASEPTPALMFGHEVLVSTLAPSDARLPLLAPLVAEDLSPTPPGGTITAAGVDLRFCEAGFSTPFSRPDQAHCQRVNFNQPGYPAAALVSWTASGGQLTFVLPEPTDVRPFAAVSLRVAVDPLAAPNIATMAQTFGLELADAAGGRALVTLEPETPALRYPPGVIGEDVFFEVPTFSGHVIMTTVRVPLTVFAGVDLARVAQLSLLFDRTDGGAIFLADVEFVR
jgi:dienelactone hydrolase